VPLLLGPVLLLLGLFWTHPPEIERGIIGYVPLLLGPVLLLLGLFWTHPPENFLLCVLRLPSVEARENYYCVITTALSYIAINPILYAACVSVCLCVRAGTRDFKIFYYNARYDSLYAELSTTSRRMGGMEV
jgi:hypothetical protein